MDFQAWQQEFSSLFGQSQCIVQNSSKAPALFQFSIISWGCVPHWFNDGMVSYKRWSLWFWEGSARFALIISSLPLLGRGRTRGGALSSAKCSNAFCGELTSAPPRICRNVWLEIFDLDYDLFPVKANQGAMKAWQSVTLAPLSLPNKCYCPRR